MTIHFKFRLRKVAAFTLFRNILLLRNIFSGKDKQALAVFINVFENLGPSVTHLLSQYREIQ